MSRCDQATEHAGSKTAGCGYRIGMHKYTESVDGPGYSATATLDLTLDRVWFVFDAQQRLWQEQAEREFHNPLRHFAIDLVIFDSRIVIDSVTLHPAGVIAARDDHDSGRPARRRVVRDRLQRDRAVRAVDDSRPARTPESTSVGLFKCVEPPVRCDSTVDRSM
jgi:hypothetical protein